MNDDPLQDTLVDVANMCIRNKWHRTGSGGYHHFSQAEMEHINDRSGCEFDSGYCFLDETGGSEGMIRLYYGESNPKWSFWIEDGQMRVDLA